MAESIDLSKKVGPLPLGAWIVVVGGGLAIGIMMNRRNKSDQGPALETEPGVGVGGSGFLPVGPPSNSGPQVEDTNESWAKRATDYLIAQGHDPSTADSAIRKYITGQALTVQERALVNIALLKFGTPPKPISGPPTQGPPPVTALTARRTSNPNANEIQITWIPSPGATSYYITQNSGGDSEATTVAPPKLWQVSPNIDVTFTVVARNENGDSEPRSVTINSGRPPRGGGGGGGGGGGHEEPPPPPPPSQRQYTIAPGDTLSGISLRFYGTANNWRQIYNANAGAIEQVARARGKSSSTGPDGTPGWWIFPGTTLVIP